MTTTSALTPVGDPFNYDPGDLLPNLSRTWGQKTEGEEADSQPNASLQRRYIQANWVSAGLIAGSVFAAICACPPAAITFAVLALVVWTLSTGYYCYQRKDEICAGELFKEVGIQTLKAGLGFVTLPVSIYRLFDGEASDAAIRSKLGEVAKPLNTKQLTPFQKQAESYYSKAGWIVSGLLCASIAAAIFACPPVAITLAVLALITFTVSSIAYGVALKDDEEKRPDILKDIGVQFIKCVLAPVSLAWTIYQSFNAEKADEMLRNL